MGLIKAAWGNRDGLSDMPGLHNESVAGQNGLARAKRERCLSSQGSEGSVPWWGRRREEMIKCLLESLTETTVVRIESFRII